MEAGLGEGHGWMADVPGIAASQAAFVHEGVVYDVIVDTSHVSAEASAAKILFQAETLA